MTAEPLAVYVHTPFCPSKCGYCDFNSYALTGEIIERTVRSIIREIGATGARGRPAKTVFFGGGTPTLLSADQLERLLSAVFEVHPPVSGCEVSIESNPGTADVSKYRGLLKSGFNRISLGAQSFDTSDLIRLGRVHDSAQIGAAMQAARNAGFDNVNLDLMFALPGQSKRAWEHNLRIALSLRPEHLSLYCLTIEQNTRFYKLHLRGMLDLPDDEAQVEMYDLACQLCAAHGYQQYEISNLARNGFECRHNVCYWLGEEYAGYGPGAVGRVGRVRRVNLKHPVGYCAAVESGEQHWGEAEHLDESESRLEKVMLGVRLNAGLSIAEFGFPTELVDGLVKRGWCQADAGKLRLTPEGRHFCSEVALALA